MKKIIKYELQYKGPEDKEYKFFIGRDAEEPFALEDIMAIFEAKRDIYREMSYRVIAIYKETKEMIEIMAEA